MHLERHQEPGCAQVALNQVALGPVVLSASFAWNLALTGQARKIGSKIRCDGPATLANGGVAPAHCHSRCSAQAAYSTACRATVCLFRHQTSASVWLHAQDWQLCSLTHKNRKNLNMRCT